MAVVGEITAATAVACVIAAGVGVRYGRAMTPRGDGKTPLHSFRVRDELWEKAKAKAAEKGEPLSAVLTRALERYVKR